MSKLILFLRKIFLPKVRDSEEISKLAAMGKISLAIMYTYYHYIFLKDFNPTKSDEMLNLLTGGLEFYPGMNINEGNKIQAPNLKAKAPTSPVKPIIVEINPAKETKDEIMTMLPKLMNSNGVEES